MTRSNTSSLRAFSGEALSDEILSVDIREARSHIAALRTAMLSGPQSPERIVGCAPGLSKAILCLRAIEQQLPPNAAKVDDADALRSLYSLKAELRAVGKLLEHGAAFHRGWARLLGAAAAGYTPSGEATPLTVRGSVAMEG